MAHKAEDDEDQWLTAEIERLRREAKRKLAYAAALEDGLRSRQPRKSKERGAIKTAA